ncbi:hypothetical protein [uncultured Maricaulis sp.]|uniref:hypothetical protein n=1 Tax=uncultured Maricaulis sp. TaxID=174710 RepID=UPI0026283EAD|nr:hypothetical protein [uncultured Maricaulis sp.]
MSKSDYQDALLDPADVFATPEAVLESAELSRNQKIELLRRWQYAAHEEAVAVEEGMSGETPTLLRRVALALESLGDDGGDRTGTANKQNGVS